MTQAKVHHPLFARFYARFAVLADRRGAAEHRRELLDGLRGRVIEIGAGSGVNFRHYPPTVTEVVAMEPEPHLRALAEEAASRAPVRVVVTDGLAEQLPTEDSSFDAGVVSLVLCSVSNQERVLAELFRVIRPNGELRFYEHVVSADTRVATLQRSIDVVWPHLAGGCHTARDTVSIIERSGFGIDTKRRFRFVPSVLGLPVSPHVIGVARRRDTGDAEAEAELYEISRDECVRLLAGGEVGRLGISTGMHPTIFPVNYLLDGEDIVFRTDAGTKLAGSVGQPVAFEIDHVDTERHMGWSVHVWGKASEVGPSDSARLRAHIFGLPLESWAPGDKEHWIRIVPAGISGRRLGAPPSDGTSG